MKKLNRFDFIPAVLASELIEEIIDKLTGVLSVGGLMDLYKNVRELLTQNELLNFEVKFYVGYKFIESVWIKTMSRIFLRFKSKYCVYNIFLT